MNSRTLLFGIALCLVSLAAFGQSESVFLPFGDAGYSYQFVKSQSSLIQKFYKTSSDTGTGWSAGRGAFGTLNNTTSPPCPLNDTAHVKTIWPSSKDLLIRKHIVLPSGVRNAKVHVAIDDAVKIYFNGCDISQGLRKHNDCATAEGDFVFSIPDTLLRAGDNILAVWGDWMSSKNYLDLQVTGGQPLEPQPPLSHIAGHLEIPAQLA